MTAKTPGLQPKKLSTLPLGQIKPAGWLLEQLKIQAGGLSGHLDEFWPSVAESRWIGGSSEGWERGPYWLDGIIPLAYLLDDEKLKAKVQFWIEQILKDQQPDGWLGPLADQTLRLRILILAALSSTESFHPVLRSDRGWAHPGSHAALSKLDQTLSEQPLKVWGHYRWADLLLSIHWLYERTGEAWLLELGARVQSRVTTGAAISKRLLGKVYPAGGPVDPRRQRGDGAQSVRRLVAPVGDPADRDVPLRMLGSARPIPRPGDRHVSCDEHLAGRSPSQGSELCAVVEAMYSLEVLLSTSAARPGRPTGAAGVQRAARDCHADMWAHQYDQQVNQVVCQVSDEHVWTSNGPESNIYGLQPNFRCCTANLHQGWPKFTSHLRDGLPGWRPDGGRLRPLPDLNQNQRGAGPAKRRNGLSL